MNNIEIIESAVAKASKHGWVGIYGELTGVADIGTDRVTVYFKDGNMRYRSLIFDHGFAIALWGEDWANWNFAHPDHPGYDGPRYVECMAWQYHLQQMVIADDPIKYLGENI